MLNIHKIPKAVCVLNVKCKNLNPKYYVLYTNIYINSIRMEFSIRKGKMRPVDVVQLGECLTSIPETLDPCPALNT